MTNNYQLKEDLYRSSSVPVQIIQSAMSELKTITKFQLLEDIGESSKMYDKYIHFYNL